MAGDPGCPRWCVVDHSAEGDALAPHHQSRGIDYAVLALREDWAERELSDDDVAQAVEFSLVAHRLHARQTTWVYFGDGERQRIELSFESFRRIAEILPSALNRVVR